MNEEKFSALIGLIVPQIVHLIVEKYSCDEISATQEFYNSEVYALLEEEDTKLWHFSPLTLFNMFIEEKETGEFYISEEG
jgi:hypothetical protein